MTLPDFRREQILEFIRQEGTATARELAEEHGVSQITVYRDLEQLAKQNLVERVRGGAKALPNSATHIETRWTQRLRTQREAKETIAAHVAPWIEDGETVFVDSSTTCLALARMLQHHPPKELTLVTNSPAIAFNLRAESIHIIMTPGEVDQTMCMVGGRWTEEFLRSLNFSTAFISAAGVTLGQGLCTTQLRLSDALHAALSVSARKVALIDSSKFGQSSLICITDARKLDALVVDPGLAPETLKSYRQAGVPIMVAGEDVVDDISEPGS